MDTPTAALPEPEERIVQELIAVHAQVSCDVVPVDAHTWAIHGSIAVDGEVILAEFADRTHAEAAAREIASGEEGVA